MHRSHNSTKLHVSKLHIGLLLSYLLSACAGSALDPENVGQGRYLQFLQGVTVHTEMDTSNAGMMDCSHQAYRFIQQTPSLKGTIRCTFQPSTDSLPYSFRAHRQLNESDGFKPASPFLVRTLTSQNCDSMRRATAALEKTVILEDLCRIKQIPSSISPAPSSQVRQQINPQPSGSASERLRVLDQLRREKLISEQEYEQKRRAIVEQL